MSQTFPEKWPARYRLPVANYPNVWQAGPVSGTLGDLGCADCTTNSATLGSLDGMLGACPQTASVYVEDNAIPTWVWLVAAVWAGLMLIKKR